MTKKKQPVQPPAPGTVISNCTITAHSAANEHTRSAVEALAAAAQANADAISQIAKALQGGSTYGIHIGGTHQ
jgi:hypothetical protein